jgi:hypothetical protein
MTTWELPKATCPKCGYQPDMHTGAGHNHRPKPGDYSICLHCYAVNRYTDDMQFRTANVEEIDDPEIRAQIKLATTALVRAKAAVRK